MSPRFSARLRAKYAKPQMPYGERLPDFVHVTGHEYFRLDTFPVGGYQKVITVSGAISWWAKDPLGHILVWPAELVTEHENGRITVAGELTNETPGVPEPWRGQLLDGCWVDA